jgi:tetraacyldisaccharide 4'-kinase
MREPAFWWREAGIAAALMSPFAALYGAVAASRLKRAGARAGVPVICVGNLTVGGAGKTPMVLTVARLLKAAGETPMLLSRGYGGRLHGPVRVDQARHRAADVGDEPLLLARLAPTFVARDRVGGAEAAVKAGASVIVMDDGFQNPSLCKDFSVLVADARRGIGNGRVIPAGPLRAGVAVQLAAADAVVMVGRSQAEADIGAAARRRGVPVLAAGLEPDAKALAALAGRPVLAFAGIGDPEKFFATLATAAIVVAAARGFPDHHRYTAAEAKALCAAADRRGVNLVTTEKDLVRIAGEPHLAQLAARVHALPVTLRLADPEAFLHLLRAKIPLRL